MFGYGSKHLSVYFKIRACLQICAANELHKSMQHKMFKAIHSSENISPKEIIINSL